MGVKRGGGGDLQLLLMLLLLWAGAADEGTSAFLFLLLQKAILIKDTIQRSAPLLPAADDHIGLLAGTVDTAATAADGFTL